MVGTFESVVLYNTPLFHFLATYLCASTILSLWCVNKAVRVQCDELRRSGILTRRVNAALSARGFNAEQFNLALKQSQAKLSGSFLLQAINNESWSANDLDVYCTQNETSNVFNALETWLWQLSQGKRCNWMDVYTAEQHDCHALFSRVLTYQINDRTTVQSMQLESRYQDIDQFIIDKYDWDFVKNTYDGRSITLHCTQSLIHRASNYYVNSTNGKLCHLVRLAKYQSRGYSALNFHTRSFVWAGVRLQEYSLSQSRVNVLGYGIHKEDVNEALTFPSNHSECGNFRYHLDATSDASFDELNTWGDYLYFQDLIDVLMRQFPGVMYTEDMLQFQTMLNQRLGQWHQFTLVR